MTEKVKISNAEVEKLLSLEEGHFADLKSTRIAPAKLTNTISAFTNADGGELFIGIEDAPRAWIGFSNQEEANGHVQAFEGLFPLGDGYNYTFLENEEQKGLVLKVEIGKSRAIKAASSRSIYLRRGAQNQLVTEPEAIERLRRNKRLSSFETETIKVGIDVIENSTHIIDFMLNVVPTAEPLPWLMKQQLIINDLPNVAGVLLFAEEPQALLPKQSGIKIYQYATKDEEGSREALMFDPVSIEGNLYQLIDETVKQTISLIEAIRIMTPEGLKRVQYPMEALHEIITNAVLHRDYSIADDIHVRIYDNRVEIQSPGTLPAHITPANILSERFARNGVIVRLINKFPNPPNKDVGEGLNTAFGAMRKMQLKDPVIAQHENNVVVILKHELLGTPQELIMKYLETHETITNKVVRETCNLPSENAVKHILKRMVEAGMLEVNKGATVFQTSYRKATGAKD